MPNHKRTPSENRKMVCLLCMTKAKTMREITEETIREHVIPGYDGIDERLPTVVCATCFTVLHEYNRGSFKRKIPLFDHHNLSNLRPMTRNQDTCACTVCEIGRSSISSFFINKRKRPSVGRPSAQKDSASEKRRPTKICSWCLGTVAKGVFHLCSDAARHENLTKIVD